MKTLGQIAYESVSDGGKQNFGSWAKAPEVVRSIHERMAAAVVKADHRRRHAAVMRMCRESRKRMNGYTTAQRAELERAAREIIAQVRR